MKTCSDSIAELGKDFCDEDGILHCFICEYTDKSKSPMGITAIDDEVYNLFFDHLRKRGITEMCWDMFTLEIKHKENYTYYLYMSHL